MNVWINNLPRAVYQRKQLKRKQLLERILSIVFMITILAAILIVGLEFTSTKLESTSWVKVVAGCCVFWFSIYGLKIILKVK
ncbi:MAG: hypothetical protein RDU14_17060 [Melioribacteraceae bacterium]|nr:hypothetical protein [Melioribacteraceae bacterium]